MTDEEKAEEYVKANHSHIMSSTMKSIYSKIYLDGLAEGRKENAEEIERLKELTFKLNNQIEKMKCCGNCSHIKYDFEDSFCELTENGSCSCVNRDKWEMKE